MKLFVLFGLLAFSVACQGPDPTANDMEQDPTESFVAFINRVEAERDRWAHDPEYWQQTEVEFHRLEMAMESHHATADEELQERVAAARARYERMRREFERLRDSNFEMIDSAARAKQMNDFGTRTFSGMPPMENVNRGNIVNYYERLVNTAENNVGRYTPQEWAGVRHWYRRLEELHEGLENPPGQEDSQRIEQARERYEALNVPERAARQEP